MISYKRYKVYTLIFLTLVGGCTKLDEKLNSTLTNQQTANALGAGGTALLLKAAYADIAQPFCNDQGQVLDLTGNSSDESLVPTRGGDWDDNGAWRSIHNHTWNADHGHILNTFNSLNKLNFDATNVLAFNPSKSQAAEAKFLRALALYQLMDLFGQYPIRNPGDNLLNAPEVKTGAAAVDFLISELTTILPDLPASSDNVNYKATVDAGKTLLMRLYLNKGAFINRASPTFADADMQQVITLGNDIINSGRYSYTANYFDNFSVDNGAKTKEGIFAYLNNSGVATNNVDVKTRWYMTLHYNMYTVKNPNAGWNGFSTTADFYNAFGVNSTPAGTPADTLLDQRIGGRYYPGATNVSGLRPGFLIGQQYNETGAALKDRKGNNLAFQPAIAADMKETGSNLEITGIRVIKYVPDYGDGGKNYDGAAGNDFMIFRYPDVVLMVAEAMMRKGTPDNVGALALVNALRAARGGAPMASMTLVNTANVDDPKTLLAERGREMYWENVRRTDLIRFGVFLKPWAYKPSDDPKNLVFPIPSQALAANPNLKQNTGY
jgi:starch-binding outer membrane protein, SusD/RagB family